MKTIKEQLQKLLRLYEKVDTDYSNSHKETMRLYIIGIMEGVLASNGKIEVLSDREYKIITYIESGWFGKTKQKTRKQHYDEFIIEKAKELIDELK